MQLGDAIEVIANPIAKAIGMKCHGADGKLKPESNCAKRKAWLNMIHGKYRDWYSGMVKLGLEKGVARIVGNNIQLRSDFEAWLKNQVTIKETQAAETKITPITLPQ